ncbi:sigma-70 family RNA polymerase sigma factor [Vagococcus sp.]|uniref:sigma-70 family RNA polymerase sigma factor n=1 Tax=Vagococcus sp. TaxID=1933889 RepID=UPI003F9EB4DA
MRPLQTDRAFFEQLYHEYEQKIFHRAYAILHNKEQAEDTTQDVFEQLYIERRKLKKLDDLHLKKMILLIVKNKSIDLYRRNQTQTKFTKEQNKQNKKETEQNNVALFLNDLMIEDTFSETTVGLGEPYHQVFMYRVFYGLTTRETAHLMNTSETTVRKQYERAKNKVKAIIRGKQHD